MSGNLAYMGNHVIDVSNPFSPVGHLIPYDLDGISLDGNTGHVTVEQAVTYNGGYVSALQMFNVYNPYAPVLRASVDVPLFARGVATTGDWIYAIHANGSTQYANGSPSGLAVYPCRVTTAVSPEPSAVQSSLGAAFPNPARHGLSTIPFTLSRGGETKLRIFDISGREIRVLVDQAMEAGDQLIQWDGKSATGDPVPAGIYFYQLLAPRFSATRKLVRIP
jgi:hypothetical protein